MAGDSDPRLKKQKYYVAKKLRPLKVIPREQWGAVPPKVQNDDYPLQEIVHPATRTVVSYTEDDICAEPEDCVKRMQELQKRDMEEGLPDLRYNFYIGNDGNVYEGRGWKYLPVMNEVWPEFYPHNYEIAHIGFHGRTLPIHMSKAAYDIVELGAEKGYITKEGKMYPNILKAWADGFY